MPGSSPGMTVATLPALRVRRLGVADDALDVGKGAAQRALDRIDVLVHLDTLIEGAAAQWKLTISPASYGTRRCGRHDGGIGGEARQRFLDDSDASGAASVPSGNSGSAAR